MKGAGGLGSPDGRVALAGQGLNHYFRVARNPATIYRRDRRNPNGAIARVMELSRRVLFQQTQRIKNAVSIDRERRACGSRRLERTILSFTMKYRDRE